MVTERPAALISETPWQHAQALAQTLAPVSSTYYLECRLGASKSDRLDVLLGVRQAAADRLNRWLSAQKADLAGLRRVGAAWSGQTGEPMAGVSALWLEYDDVAPNSAACTPAISACLLSSYDDSTALSCERIDAFDGHKMLAVFETLMGRPMSPEDRARLDRCLAHLPARARIIHASVMLGRPAEPAKLYLMIPRDDLSTFLMRVGFRGDIASIERLVEEYCPSRRVADELYLDLTFSSLDADRGGLLGLVFSPQHLIRSAERDPGRGPLLEECVRAKLCTEAQRRSLQGWPGESLRNVAGADQVELLVERWLDLKLVWSPREALALKGYLGLHVRIATPLDRPRLQSMIEAGQVALRSR